MSNLRLHEGTGSFVFSDDAAGARRSIRIFYFRPQLSVRHARVIIAMHGLDRAAAEVRDVLAGQAERNKQIVLVPEFGADAFPDVYAYNYGNVRLAPPSQTFLPRKLWNFCIIDRLFRYVRTTVDSSWKTFGLFGNSAGSQYVLRYLALTEAPAVDVAVASNSGMYMLPDLTVDYPIGMGGLGLDESYQRRYFARRLIILLGDADTDSAAPDLPRNETAMAQGPHRLARGFWHFGHCKKVAERLGVQLGWKLEIVPGAGHVGQQIFNRAANILAN
jgi:hypothetical protein